VDGKADWLGHGLPRESENAGVPYAGDLVDADPPYCALSDDASVVRARLEGSGHAHCLVLGDGRVVLGRVSRSALDSASGHATAEELMEAGPSTVRPNTPVSELEKRLAESDLETMIVTTPRGQLLGVYSSTAGSRSPRMTAR
jgi:hypothetical protein